MNIVEGLRSYWKLDGNSRDFLGGNYHGTDTSIVYSALDGKINSGAGFVATSVSNIAITPVAIGSVYSIVAWVKPADTTHIGCIMYGAPNGFYWNAGGMLTWYTGAQHTSSLVVTQNVWNHVALTADGTTVRFYINGALDPITYALSTAFTPTTLGSDSFAADTITGSMDEVGLWTRCLSGSDISYLYNSGSGMSIDNSVDPIRVYAQRSGSIVLANFTVPLQSFAQTSAVTNYAITGSSVISVISASYAAGDNTVYLSTSGSFQIGNYTLIVNSGTVQSSTNRIFNSAISSSFDITQASIATSSADSTPPTITNFSPSTGSTVASSQILSFDVTDASSSLRAIAILCQLSGTSIYEVVHDSTNFGPYYQNSQRTVISGGYTYYVLRTGGWVSAPQIYPIVVDASGNLNT